MLPTEDIEATGQPSQGEQDLGPLAWVLEELRKSLDASVKATRRFVREAQEGRDSDLAALDVSPLRMAKQQLHQSSGALEMVGMPQAALLLRAMETALQHFVQNPADCTEAVVQTLEKASFALLEYLEAVLAGQRISAVALFPQYRDVQGLYGNAGKVHPADLWPVERRLREPDIARMVEPLGYGAAQRAVLDAAVLQMVKGQDMAAASTRICEVCLGFAQAQTESALRIFWKVAAGYFDAMAHGLLPVDIYTKRVASRVLMVSAALAKGEAVAPERLLQDMLFFCAQAAADTDAARQATVWQAVYTSFGLQRHGAVNYEQARFGRFDPTLLAQARKRIAAATDIWSALAGGDLQKIKPAVDQFTLVCDSLNKLHPGSQVLARALMQVVHSVASRGQPPSAEVAMEVATAVLYLQAAFASLDLADEAMAAHGATLAERLLSVLGGAASQPLEPWMEQLYRQVSDQQTMGSVVGELRGTLAEAEKLLDQYFRNPADTSMLGAVGVHLAQMRGVLSVLGLDQAAQAMVRMRQNVERLLQGDLPEQEQRVLFEKMGNSLGALGFLIDMLSYQRNMARKLYEFDEQEGELKLRMGRARVRATDAAADASPQALLDNRAVQLGATQSGIPLPPLAAGASQEPAAQPVELPAASAAPASTPPAAELPPEPAVSTGAPAPATLQVQPEDTDSELLDIFLEEAREVVGHGLAALQTLAEDPANLSEQTVLRRAFHTLKGSSRMVGLDEFGQAGWAMEQMLNAWLAEQKAMPEPMQALAMQALQGFEAWVEAIAANAAQQWQSAPFRASADAMRLHARWIPLDMDAVRGMAPATVAEPVATLQPDHQQAADALSLSEVSTASENSEDIAPDVDKSSVAADFVLEFDVPEAPPATELAPAPERAEDGIAAVPEAEEISFAEFDALMQATAQPDAAAAVSALPPVPVAGEDTQAASPPVPALELQAPQALAPEVEPPAQVMPAPSVDGPVPPSSTKQIGDLSISLPLFNVYLNEAEGWSYRLLDALTAWQEKPHEPQPDMVEAWAHSLAGSSATVGFTELSGLARQLEHALQHVAPQPCGVPEQVACLVRAAEEIRAMLHQFAAGFLPRASQDVHDALQRILDTGVSAAPLVVAEPVADAVADDGAELVAPATPDMDALTQAPPPAPTLPAASEEAAQEIDAQDVIDPDLFPIFEEEALELLPVLGGAMREWAAHPTRLEARATLLRVLHTLKGSARLAGAMRMGEMAHRLESALEALDVDTVTTEQIEPLFARLDAMEANFNLLRAVGAQADSAPLRMEPAAVVQKTEPAPEAADPATSVLPALPVVPAEAPAVFQDAAAQAADVAVAPLPLSPAAVAASATATVRQSSQPTVRVRAQLLDRLVNEAGEVMIARSRLDERVTSMKASLSDLAGNLDKLRQQLRDVEVQAESQMQSRMQLSKEAGMDFDPLEFDRFTRVQELTRMMAESVNDVATVQRNLQRDVAGAEDDLMAQSRQARELQRDLLRTRMVEFEAIAERLHAVVRLTAKETGKQVKLTLSGGTIEMDRGVLERMLPAFEHLLRNCVDHGIELPEQRQAAGKPVMGTISIQVQQEGNDVAVTFQDDGAGLNVQRIRERALAQGLIGPQDSVDAARAAQLVFMPGLTTAEQLTGVSGRGIGMDVVRSEVQALGGRIETHTTPGQGSAFRLVLPLTTAVTQVVMLRVGDFSVGVPASLVEVVRRVPLDDLETAYRTGVLQEGGESVAFYWGGAVWNQSPRSLEAGVGKTRPVVIFRSAAQRIALHVDEVLGHQEVVVKNLGPQMSRLPGLTGMSVLPSGAVVLIYNPVALTAVYGDQIRQQGAGLPALLDAHTARQLQREVVVPQSQADGVAATEVPLVMVVDDSITVRRVSQRLLQREGYRVVTASDGLQALEKLQEEMPCVVLSDIEMPRMDGFDLLRNIRSQPQLQQLPVIMITSRMAQKHRDHAFELGANHYLGKPYADEELMALVHHYAVGKPLPPGSAHPAAAGGPGH